MEKAPPSPQWGWEGAAGPRTNELQGAWPPTGINGAAVAWPSCSANKLSGGVATQLHSPPPQLRAPLGRVGGGSQRWGQTLGTPLGWPRGTPKVGGPR